MTDAVLIGGNDIVEVVRSRAIFPVFQPVFDLTSTEIVGFEALARGPEGTALERPGALFGAAREHGLTAELDWVCRAAAFGAFMQADAPPALTLLVNAEPESFGTECPGDLLPIVHRAEELLRVMVEVNDRALAADPAELLAIEHRARSMGWGIALDDVGSGHGAIAMIPVVRPDIVKIDLNLLRTVSDADASAVILAATRHVESTGAALCVESIENDEDRHWARALGAKYGQGIYLGAPMALPQDLRAPRQPLPLVAPPADVASGDTPWGMVEGLETHAMSPDHFVEWARIVARGAIAPGVAPVILSGVGRGAFDADVAATFPHEAVPLLSVAFGVDISDEPLPGLRGVRLTDADPLADTVFLVVLSEVGGIALLGKGQADGRILSVMTQATAVVEDIAHHLIRRIPRFGSDGAALAPPVPRDVEHQEANVAEPQSETVRGRRLFNRR